MQKIVTETVKKFLYDDIYIAPADAKKEIENRWRNDSLKKEVLLYLKGVSLLETEQFPKAVLARSVASPNHEYFEFLKLANLSGFEGWCLEFLGDKFRAENFDKYYLGKLFFHFGIGRNGGRKTTTYKLVDFDASEGKKMIEMKTVEGESFIQFHHNLLLRSTNDKALFRDCTEWIASHGSKGADFYPYFLANFLCFGVLFENFLINDKILIGEMFLPAIEELKNRFDLYPLVVPLAGFLNEEDIFWRQYPGNVEDFLKNSSLH